MGCIFPIIIVSILPKAEFGINDHRADEAFYGVIAQETVSEYEIVYDDNSSQELDDDDVEHLIEEGQNEIEEESDQVYSS